VEIGKREIRTAEQIAAIRDDITYTSFDLVELARDEPETVRALLGELMRRFADQTLQPLPYQVFGLPQTVDAFRRMALARHIGKIVVSHDDAAAAPALVRPDATYLVTGGLGALGLHTARWLVEQGARNLVLVSRGGITAANEADVSALREEGARVQALRCDIARPDDVAQLFEAITASLPPLRGVVHAAGVLDDGILLQQRWPRFERVLAPKLAGAWNLHQATREMPLDFFVLFSSIASLLGSAGQGNYAAGNAFADLLAAERRRQGLAALSLNWGPWRGAGMAGSMEERGGQGWALRGMGLIEPQQGLAELATALDQPRAQLGVAAIAWEAYLRQFPAGRQPPLLDGVAAAGGADTPAAPTTGGGHRALPAILADAPDSARYDLIVAHVQDLAARVLGLAAAHTLDIHRPLNEVGFDSLMAVELRNALSLSIDRTLPATLLFDYPTVQALAGFVAKDWEPADAAAVPSTVPAGADADSVRESWLAEIENLSDAEVEALLEQELSQPRRKDRHE
jgi:NAD(P)-dependent dehydrogenase (short-subunit alcohol dehydrogenase family)/acyl carrier protein